MKNAPIALFVYNRPGHVRKAIDALRDNKLAGESELFIFSDGPNNKKAEEKVSQVRKYIKTVTGFKRIVIVERGHNYGLSRSVIAGVTEVVTRYGSVIVLEDDMVTSPYFLKFMNDALSAYKDEERVISVCAYLYPGKKKYSDVFFLRIPDCWGWATWKRGWDLFESDGEKLYGELRVRGLSREFDLEGNFNFTKMLRSQIEGKNDSWAVRWYASAILNRKLSLHTHKALVMNIGIDGSGRHRGVKAYCSNTRLADEPVIVKKVPIIEDESAIKEVKSFLRVQMFSMRDKVLGLFRKLIYNNEELNI